MIDERHAASEFLVALQQWLDQVVLPPGLRDWGLTASSADLTAARAWQRLLHDGGWAGLAWPLEHGGRAASPADEADFCEELARRGLPRQISVGGIDVAGPILIRYGTPRQQQLLPLILTGKHVWCQLWSEPDAGSDLANIRTRAVPSGDGWLATGQKVWASAALFADYALLLARTSDEASPQAGITMFALPMDRAGITVRPIAQLDGESKFNEVYLDGVVLEPQDVLGPVGEGWRVLGSAAGRERLTIGAQAISLFRALTALREDAARLGLTHDAVFRQQFVSCWSRTWTLRVTFRRLLATTDGLSDPRLSMLKLAATELTQEMTALFDAVHGIGLVSGQQPEPAGRLLAARGATIAGGTSEVQRNILAERVLGLPREPR